MDIKTQLFVLDNLTTLSMNHIKKMDWLLMQLSETLTGDDALVLSLALDTLVRIGDKMDEIEKLKDELGIAHGLPWDVSAPAVEKVL